MPSMRIPPRIKETKLGPAPLLQSSRASWAHDRPCLTRSWPLCAALSASTEVLLQKTANAAARANTETNGDPVSDTAASAVRKQKVKQERDHYLQQFLAEQGYMETTAQLSLKHMEVFMQCQEPVVRFPPAIAKMNRAEKVDWLSNYVRGTVQAWRPIRADMVSKLNKTAYAAKAAGPNAASDSDTEPDVPDAHLVEHLVAMAVPVSLQEQPVLPAIVVTGLEPIATPTAVGLAVKLEDDGCASFGYPISHILPSRVSSYDASQLVRVWSQSRQQWLCAILLGRNEQGQYVFQYGQTESKIGLACIQACSSTSEHFLSEIDANDDNLSELLGPTPPIDLDNLLGDGLRSLSMDSEERERKESADSIMRSSSLDEGGRPRNLSSMSLSMDDALSRRKESEPLIPDEMGGSGYQFNWFIPPKRMSVEE